MSEEDFVAEVDEGAYFTHVTSRNVLDRDNWQCQACGTGGENRLHVHHVVFRSQGGSDDPSNLVTVCWKCHERIHAGKLSISLVLLAGTYKAFCNRRHAP